MGQTLAQPIESQLLQRRGNVNYKVGTAEMQGRRIKMEDTHIVVPSLSERHPEVGLFGVFDGHSGTSAAEFLLRELWPRLAALEDPTSDSQISHCVQQLDWDFLKYPELRMEGSTCTFCITHPHPDSRGLYVIIAVNVGDSRSVLVAPDGTVTALTADHKPLNVNESKRIQAAGGHVRMGRVDGELAMSRAIGDWQYKHNPNLPLHEQKVIAVPDITRNIAKPGDVLLVMCDGLIEQLTNEAIGKYARQVLDFQGQPGEQDLAYVCFDLNRFSLSHQSKDNHSVVLVSFEDGSDYEREDEFIPGPTSSEPDSIFSDLYFADAKKHGWEGERLMALIARTEVASLNRFETLEVDGFSPPTASPPPSPRYDNTFQEESIQAPSNVASSTIESLPKFTLSTSCAASSGAASSSSTLPPLLSKLTFSTSCASTTVAVVTTPAPISPALFSAQPPMDPEPEDLR